MTDQDLLDIISELMGVTSAEIEGKVNIHKRSAISRIYARTKPYWVRSAASISLSANAKTVDLRTHIPDIWQLRFLYTTQGRLDWISEEIFRAKYARNTGDSGVPQKYTTLDNYNIELWPIVNSAMTLYANVYFRPDFNSIASLPEEWQFVAQDYVQAMMMPKQFPIQLFIDGLNDLKAMVRPAIEEDFEFEQSAIQLAVNQQQSSFNRSR